MAEPAVRMVRILSALNDAINESRPETFTSLMSVYDSCFGCCLKGTQTLFNKEPDGFWALALEIFRKEGLDVDAFLIDARKRWVGEDHDYCGALRRDWVIDWIAEHIQ